MTNVVTYQDNKRRLEANSESEKRRKRFVWPPHLHRDFVSAVFDVGLQAATVDKLKEKLQYSGRISSEHIKSYLAKFRIYRESKRKALSDAKEGESRSDSDENNDSSEEEVEEQDWHKEIRVMRERKEAVRDMLQHKCAIYSYCIIQQKAFLSALNQMIECQREHAADISAYLKDPDGLPSSKLRIPHIKLAESPQGTTYAGVENGEVSQENMDIFIANPVTTMHEYVCKKHLADIEEIDPAAAKTFQNGNSMAESKTPIPVGYKPCEYVCN